MWGNKNKDLEPKEMVLVDEVSAVTAIQLSPVEIMQQAKAAGLEIADMKEMLALQKEYEANEARKAFHQALADFKSNPPVIVKDMLNSQYGSGYVSIGNMVNTVNESLGDHGLNARWDFPVTDSDVITCTCILSHRLGHEESVTLDGPVDVSGSKNPLQGRKSTRTYLKLETFEAVTGVASIVGNTDDDGNSFSQQKTISAGQVLDLESLISEVGADKAAFLRVCKIERLEDLPESKLKNAIKRLEEKR